MKQILFSSRYRPLGYIIAMIVIVASLIIAYYPSLSYEFQFDDLANITRYFNIRHNTFWQLFFSGTRWISYWLNALFYQISGFDPFVYRVGSVTIHALNALLVFLLFNWLLKSVHPRYIFFKSYSFLLALSTALLFAVHPVQTQTVSYVIQSQLEGLATLSILLLSLLFLFYSTTHSWLMRIIAFCLLIIVAALSTGTKEVAIVAPFLILLTDYFFIAQGKFRSLFSRWLAHSAIAIIVIGFYIYFLKPAFFMQAFGLKISTRNNIGNIITTSPQQLITPIHYALSQFKVIVHYITIFLWPCNISVEYDWRLVDSFFSPDCFLPFLILSALFTFIFILIYRRGVHPIAFGFLWFFIVLAPRSTIIPSPELIVDYKTYMASPGILFVIVALLFFGIQCIIELLGIKKSSRIFYWVLPLFIVMMGIPLTRMRNTVWRSGIEFWMNIILNAPGKARAYNNYGVELAQKQGLFAEAIPYYQKAIAMDRYYSDPCNNLAVSYAALNRIDDAIVAIKQGLAIYPYYPEGYNNLASFYLNKKEYDLAERALKVAIQMRPYYGKAHYNLGRLYIEQGKNNEAWECFRTCCHNADLDNEIGFEGYAQVSVLCKKYDVALEAYNRLLKMQPHNKEYQFGLANAYHALGDYQKAKKLYNNLVKEYPYEGRFQYNLGETFFALADYHNALPLFQNIVQAGSCPAQAVVRLAGCHEGLGRADIAYNLLEQLKRKLDEKERDAVQEAQNRMLKVYGKNINSVG